MAAAPAFAGSSPWELTSLHAPTNVPLRPSVNQVMTLSFHANTGKFLLEFSNEQTGEEGESKYLPFDATAKEVLDALEKLRSGEPKTAIGPGNVVVNGGYDPATETGTYTIEFTGLLGGRYLGEEVLEVRGEIPPNAKKKSSKKKKKRPAAHGNRKNRKAKPKITTPGYHDTVDYQLIPVNRSATPIESPPPEHPLTIHETLPAGVTTVRNAAGGGGERRTGRRRVDLQSPPWACRKGTRTPGASAKKKSTTRNRNCLKARASVKSNARS